jgi:mono/diheme cytochrome c family protein
MPVSSEGSAQTWRRWGALLWLGLAVSSLPGCDLGGGGGGGAALTPLPPRPIRAQAAEPADGATRGELLFRDQACRLCHGDQGKGGVSNANSETGGKINGLTLVKEGYTREELIQRLRNGVPKVGRKDPGGPVPPLRMLPYGRHLSERQIADLADYVLSLYPKDRAEDDWDAEPAKGAAPAKPGARP